MPGGEFGSRKESIKIKVLTKGRLPCYYYTFISFVLLIIRCYLYPTHLSFVVILLTFLFLYISDHLYMSSPEDVNYQERRFLKVTGSEGRVVSESPGLCRFFFLYIYQYLGFKKLFYQTHAVRFRAHYSLKLS